MDEFLTTGPVAGTHLDGGVGAVGDVDDVPGPEDEGHLFLQVRVFFSCHFSPDHRKN